MASNKKRKTCWNDKYGHEFPFIKKSDDERVFCNICSSNFSIIHGGRADIVDHTKTLKHQNAIQTSNTSKKVTDFFKKIESTNDEQQIAAKEASVAYHTVKHNFSFRSNDCTSELVRRMFEPKFSMGRTKSSAIVHVISSHILNEIRQEVANFNFISIITDTSNHKNIKILPIAIRSFNPVKGVVHKLISTVSIQDEKTLTVSNEIMKMIEEEKLNNRIVAFSADNNNLNFDGVNRNGINNVWRKLQALLHRDIIGNGCYAHISHNASSAGCETLDLDIEALVVKIYKHFSIYTVRTEEFKKLCDEIEITFKPLLVHSGTRFLSLEPAIDIILELFESLKKYFMSSNNCPPVIKAFFKDSAGKFWLLFISNQLKNFSESIKFMETSSTASFQAAFELKILKEKIFNRRKFGFLTRESQTEFSGLSEMVQRDIKNKVDKFYFAIIEYLELWEKSCDGTDIFSWMVLNKLPSWDNVQKSYEFVCKKIGSNSIINHDLLFDEYGQMREFIESNIGKWNEEKIAPEHIWILIFKFHRENATKLINMEKLVEFAFSIPGTSTEIERIFSLMNQNWDDQKSCLSLDSFNFIDTI